METVNLDLRVFDKTTGNLLLDQSLDQFFGVALSGQPYVVYDDIANRWYVSALDSSHTGLFLAVSNDSNALDGFSLLFHLTNISSFPDYQKLGYNRDAIFISFNNFGGRGPNKGDAEIVSIDKAQLLVGTLVYYVSTPASQFRAMPPAQMHGDTQGGVEWFVSTDGTDVKGTTIRVTKMTNYLSNSPTFTYTHLPVSPYRKANGADQPGGPATVTVFPNTTTTQVHFRNGDLLTAMASAAAADGFVYPKGRFYHIQTSPRVSLFSEGLIDPGSGVAVQMPTVDMDSNGNLGLTWMESSTTEFLSMWVGSSVGGSQIDSSAVAAPGGGFSNYSFRIGDYSTTVVDPSDRVTFWSANEYIGSDGSTDIWRTHITSFTAN
jgi:hypothetical protein